MKIIPGSPTSTIPVVALLLAASPPLSLLANIDEEPPPAAVPFISIMVDGNVYPGPRLVALEDDSGKVYYGVDQFRFETEGPEGFQISLDAILNPDPSIGYAIGVVDLGAPSVFAFAFAVPIVPTGSPNAVDASIVGGLTDFTGDGVSITPTPGAAIQMSSVGAPLTSMGVDVGPAFSGGPGAPGALYGYGSFGAGPIPGPGPGPWTLLQTLVSFRLSGNSDAAALTGFAQIVETSILVPESGTSGSAALLGTMVGAWFWRRRRAAQS